VAAELSDIAGDVEGALSASVTVVEPFIVDQSQATELLVSTGRGDLILSHDSCRGGWFCLVTCLPVTVLAFLNDFVSEHRSSRTERKS
jgi:hypothetical protein